MSMIPLPESDKSARNRVANQSAPVGLETHLRPSAFSLLPLHVAKSSRFLATRLSPVDANSIDRVNDSNNCFYFTLHAQGQYTRPRHRAIERGDICPA